MAEMTAQERQWYQIVKASGMSADYINKPMHCLDPIWTIEKREDDTPRLRTEIQERLKRLPTYTEYAQGCALSAERGKRVLREELAIYINFDNEFRVDKVDALAKEMRAEAEKPPDQMNLVFLLEKAQAISEIIQGKSVPIQQISHLRVLGY